MTADVVDNDFCFALRLVTFCWMAIARIASCHL
jgi:hypothetical protein